MKKSEYFSIWSQLHGNARISGVVKAWMSVSFLLCSGLKKIKVTPNFLTYFSLVLASGYLLLIESNWAILFLVLSLAADGLDGTLAIISDRVSKWGAALDATVDRVVEAIWLFGLHQLGAPIEIVLLIWIAAFAQEYLRARAGGLGVTQIGVVTVGERPVRASMIFVVLVGRAFGFDLIEQVAMAWAVLQLLSALTVLSFLRPLLQQSQR